MKCKLQVLPGAVAKILNAQLDFLYPNAVEVRKTQGRNIVTIVNGEANRKSGLSLDSLGSRC